MQKKSLEAGCNIVLYCAGNIKDSFKIIKEVPYIDKFTAKKTSELIPLCHNLPISYIDIDFKIDKTNLSIEVLSEVKTQFSTGVEMEALTACSVAGLVIYDMCKSLDKKIVMTELKLLFKKGGKSGTFEND